MLSYLTLYCLGIREASKETIIPILKLLDSDDVEVQRAATAALGNLAVNSANKKLIVDLGGLTPLIKHMLSPNVEVQCNAVGCMTNLATHEQNKSTIARSGALIPLTNLAKSKDMRVQRNAAGALLNMTHSGENRKELVNAGAIPVLVSSLTSTDPDVQYYCTTTLSNIAVDPENRKKLADEEPRLVYHLVQLMGPSNSGRVQCQAALALRNLASDSNYQIEVVRANGLPFLLDLVKAQPIPLVLAAAACIRNVSINKANERFIVSGNFLPPLVHLLDTSENEEILCHATSTLRNLAASSEQNRVEIVDAGAIEKIRKRIMNVPAQVQSEMTACLAVIALGDAPKTALFDKKILDILIYLSHSDNVEIRGNSAAAIGNLSNKANSYAPFVANWETPVGGIKGFLISFLRSDKSTFEHIATWMILQLLESDDRQLQKLLGQSQEIVDSLQQLASKLQTPENGQANGASEKLVNGAEMASSQRAVPQLAEKALQLISGQKLKK